MEAEVITQSGGVSADGTLVVAVTIIGALLVAIWSSLMMNLKAIRTEIKENKEKSDRDIKEIRDNQNIHYTTLSLHTQKLEVYDENFDPERIAHQIITKMRASGVSFDSK